MNTAPQGIRVIDVNADLEARTRKVLEDLTGVEFIGDHLAPTPTRFMKMMKQLLTAEQFNFTKFPNTEHMDEMVTVGPVDYYSLCAHHVIPFFGQAWVSYIPKDTIAGLSKLARTIKFFQRGLWVQEELTNTIADYLVEQLQPLGVGVVMNGRHLCMEMRGVEQTGAITTTSAMRGVYLDPSRGARTEFLSYTKGNK